jgi:hypothetical protein
MKKNIFYSMFLVVSVFAGTASFGQITLPSIITTTTPGVVNNVFQLSAGNTYLINGKVYVQGGVTLAIDEGVLIKGVKKATPAEASALVITRSGRIEANGTITNPIVFTSNETVPVSGDWGGVVVLGSAPLNRADTSIEGIDLPSLPAGVDVNYGGGGAGLGNPDENKGVIKYVRIEYAGAVISNGNELNTLTSGGVGRGTLYDYIQASYGNDDGFEWFGGTVNAKHLISMASDDDNWDFDFGYSGHLQYVVSVQRLSKATYSSDPNGIESDNDGAGSANAPRTNVSISNMTTIGVEDSLNASEFLPAPGSKRFLYGARFRRNTSLTVRNSIFMGYPTGVRFESAGTIADATRFANNIVHGFRVTDLGASIPTSNLELLGDVTAANDRVQLTNPFDVTNPNFRPLAASPAFSGADFVGLTSVPSNFFALNQAGTVFPTYRGAFAPGSSNWAGTWTRFF